MVSSKPDASGLCDFRLHTISNLLSHLLGVGRRRRESLDLRPVSGSTRIVVFYVPGGGDVRVRFADDLEVRDQV